MRLSLSCLERNTVTFSFHSDGQLWQPDHFDLRAPKQDLDACVIGVVMLNIPNAATMQGTSPTVRLWEVDTLRGIAVVLMVFFHFVWDLTFFGRYRADMLSGPWYIFGRSIGATFIFLFGVSLTLSYARQRPTTTRPAPLSKAVFRRYVLRGSKLFGLGLAITLVTYVATPSRFVLFGVLHLLGCAMILAYPFLLVQRWISLLAGLLIIGTGFYVNQLPVSFPWLLWLGVEQRGRNMSDYYPLLPWFGFALIGIWAGQRLYPGGRRCFDLPDLAHVAPIRALSFLGRHSLVIYLVHQPVLLALLIGLGVGSL